MGPLRSPRNRVRRPALMLGLVLGLAACTKVVEQPVAEPIPPPEKPNVPPKFPAPAKPRPWPSSAPAPAPPPPPKPAEPPRAETLNGDPDGLKMEQLQGVLDGAMDRFAGCVEGNGTTSVALSFEASPAGKAENVKVAGGGAAAERCVSGVVGSLRLPTFSGRAVPVHFPITVRRTVTPPAEGSGSRAGRPSAPPL